MGEPGPPAAAARTRAGAALRAALAQPAVWSVVWLLEAGLAVAPALLLHGWLSAAIDHRYAPGSLFADLDSTFRFDQRAGLRALDDATARIGAVLVLLSIVLGAFAAGGWLQVFLEPARARPLRSFALGGARFFWRFARIALSTLLLLALLGWVVQGPVWDRAVLGWILDVPAADASRLETLASERTVFVARAAREATYAVGFALVLAWGDFARTRLALEDAPSAVGSGLGAALTLLRHPVRTLRPMAALLLLESALLLAAGFLARSIESDVARDGGIAGVIAMFGIGQLVLAWRIVLRGARYHAAVAVTRAVVPPPSRPDPWRSP